MKMLDLWGKELEDFLVSVGFTANIDCCARCAYYCDNDYGDDRPSTVTRVCGKHRVYLDEVTGLCAGFATKLSTEENQRIVEFANARKLFYYGTWG